MMRWSVVDRTDVDTTATILARITNILGATVTVSTAQDDIN